MLIKSIKKDYGEVSKILVYNRSVRLEPPKCSKHQQIACPICWKRSVNPVPSPSSLMRTKTLVTDYTLANNFDLFTTFTYDPKKVDSFNIDEAKKKMENWLSNSKKHSPDLAYLIVPELHKSGRIHFHALFKNYKGNLTDSGLAKNGRKIYNIDKWLYGFSTAVEIDDIGKVSSYIQKYITKDMLKIGNKKRYWASRNLIKPKVDYNINMVEEVYSRPLFILGKHTDEYYKIYKIMNTHSPLSSVAVEAEH